MKNKYLVLSLVFCLGYIASDILAATGIPLGGTASAEVAGMTSYDLARDTDFKRAVTEIVEDTISSYNYKYDRNFKRAVTIIVEDLVEDCNYSGAYVDGEYIRGGSISC